MIKFTDLYCVLSAVVPLYVTMFLAYASVKYWQVFTPDQCSGINRFVAIFAVPLLSFEFISRINPYKAEFLFIAADVVSKVIVLSALFLWAKFYRGGSIDWLITNYSLSTLPNTLVMGIPLLKSMYGDDKEGLMTQAVVMQSLFWYTLLLFLFEYRAARILIMQKLKGGKTDRGDEKAGIQKMGGSEEEMVHVIVARPTPAMNLEPLDSDQQKLQNAEKTAPGSALFKPAEEDGKELHLFIWRCGCCNSEGFCEQSVQVCSKEEENGAEKADNNEKVDSLQPAENSSPMSLSMIRLIMKMVCFKLLRNPNSYASVFGLTWALVSGRWGIKKPLIMENSVTILSNAGLGMAMFSLGLFMALQPRIIACGTKLAVYGMLVRFLAGPAVMAIASVAVGLKGTILKVSIVQAALPQGIVPFVFAREYNLHPDVLSTTLIFGMIVSLPITILYYILLGI